MLNYNGLGITRKRFRHRLNNMKNDNNKSGHDKSTDPACLVDALIILRSISVKYAVDLARKNSEALSFIPAPRLEQYADSGQLMIETENNDPCGFIVFGNNFPMLRIYQACIQYDARRIQHGLNLLHRLITYAGHYGFTAISLYCADDLEANQFWRAAGFQFAGQRPGGKRRGRMHNRWFLYLDEPLQLELAI